MGFDELARKAREVADKAQDVVKERGGTEALKQDAQELREILTGEGGLADKAKRAAAAVRDPGRPGPEPPGA
jgi:hypothetical protein